MKLNNVQPVKGHSQFIYANLVILATAVTYYQLSGGESGTLRWLRSLLDKLDINCPYAVAGDVL